MTTPHDAFPQLALKQARSPDVARLFEELARRAGILAAMQDEFTRSIIRHREAREGKPFRFSRTQKRTLANFDRDAEQAAGEMDRIVTGMDDAALLASALSEIDQEIQLDERMLSSWHDDDKPMARRLLEFQRETKRLIEQFLERSPFRVSARSIWPDGPTTKKT